MTVTDAAGEPVQPEPVGRAIPETFVEFCGERILVSPDEPFHIGREADLDIDDNPYLHRKFLMLHHEDGLWWLSNVGSHLSAGVVAGDAGFQATLAPGARLPLVFGVTAVVFSAGPTTYELEIHSGATPLTIAPPEEPTRTGEATIGVVSLTDSQKLLIVVLAEEVLRRSGTGASSIPSSAQAAARVGWSITKFNRKLDNVCDKFDQIGVSGVRGGSGRQASNRRVKLVEYAVASRLVTRDDLPLIDEEARRNGLGTA
jgi:hypothetical protein